MSPITCDWLQLWRAQGGENKQLWLRFAWEELSVATSISYPESSGFLVSGATPGRLWGHRILLPQDFCGKTMETVTEQPIKKIDFFRCPQSLPGVAPLTKKPEDSGYEIVATQSRTQSPQAFWSAGRRQERLWDNGISYPRKRGIPVFVRMLKIKTEVKCPKIGSRVDVFGPEGFIGP